MNTYKCAGPSCPGLPYRASDIAHPPTCAAPRCPSRWAAYECEQATGHAGMHATRDGFTRWPDSADDRDTFEDGSPRGCCGEFETGSGMHGDECDNYVEEA